MKRNLARYFELQDPEKGRWLSMEGLRGTAVILVFFVHYSSGMMPYFNGGAESPRWLDAVHELGNVGVDLFFVLSGFLIYRAVIRGPIDYAQFAYRRIERIYPVFLFVLCNYLLLSYLFPAHSKIPASIPDAFAYILANILLLPGITNVSAIITVAWSLSYEALYYILIPLVTGALVMRRWQSRQRLAFFSAILAVYILAQWLGHAVHFRMTMFIGGILLYEFSHRTGAGAESAERPWLDRLSLMLCVVGLACFTLLGASRWAIAGTAAAGIPAFFKFVILNAVFVLLVHRCLFGFGPAARLFSVYPLRWLGNMSYTYYLTHSLGLHLFFMTLSMVAPEMQGSVLLYCALVPLAMALTICVSVPVYLLVERPISLSPSKKPRPVPDRRARMRPRSAVS